jgi:SAM-dependent methyltransferase
MDGRPLAFIIWVGVGPVEARKSIVRRRTKELPVGPHVCPWWGGYFIDNPLRRWLHNPEQILAPYVKPGMATLDFGCGMGVFTLAMARLVGEQGRVVAADLQPQMLDVVQRRSKRAGVTDRIRTHRCQPASTGLDEPFDFALAFWSVHEVRDMKCLFAEVFGCLRPEGRFLAVEPIGHVTTEAFAGMMQLAAEAGFREQERPRVRLSHAVVLAKP